MMKRTIAGCGLAVGLLTALSACAPGYYPGYPAYYARPAYPHPPSQPATPARPRGGDWINPEPTR